MFEHDPSHQKTSTASEPHESSSTMRAQLAANPLPTWIYGLETLAFLEVNEAAVTHYGYSRDQFLAMTIQDIRPDDERDRLLADLARERDTLMNSGIWRHRRSDGTVIDVEVTSHLITWDGHSAALVVAHDVTEIRRLQNELFRRTHFDEATGLANASLFTEQVAAALERQRANSGVLGVFVIALDHLEEVASTMGDKAADSIVIATAERLQACCTTHETIARLGGRRFAVAREAPDQRALLDLANMINRALAPPMSVPGRGDVKSSASVGLAIAEIDDDVESLLANATSAMRHAGERYGGHFSVSSSESREKALDAFHAEQGLARAAQRGQLRLHYQPVVDLNGGDISCESLVRWDRPGFGLVGPDQFIPLAERSGLIVDVGAWVIENAIADAAAWQQTSPRLARVGINLSAHQLHDEHLVERFVTACDKSNVTPSSICVELTESAFVATNNFGDYRALATLRELGFEIAIDDFGTGYSSLSYLKHLPVDIIKIDRAFVAGLGVDPTDAMLVQAIINVVHGLGLRAIAEGVETEAQVATLRELGCDAAQGYFFARPVPSAELPLALVRARQLATC